MRRIDLESANKNVKEFFKELKEDEEYVLEEGGKPSFLVLSPKGKEAVKAEVLSMLQKVWERNRKVPEDVVEKEVQEAIQAIKTKYTPSCS
ncbi:MAG: hypothetical protein Q6359_03450 [Candidatus Brocadiales bacterium]|nr:hypothetical protein [Candidatus Brocadiales bacterium]